MAWAFELQSKLGERGLEEGLPYGILRVDTRILDCSSFRV